MLKVIVNFINSNETARIIRIAKIIKILSIVGVLLRAVEIVNQKVRW